MGLHATASWDLLCALPALLSRQDCACKIAWNCKSLGFRGNLPSLSGDACRGGSSQGKTVDINKDSFFFFLVKMKDSRSRTSAHLYCQCICYEPASALCNVIVNELKRIPLLLFPGHRKQSEEFICSLVIFSTNPY